VTRSVPQGIAEVAHLVSASTVADWTEARYRN